MRYTDHPRARAHLDHQQIYTHMDVTARREALARLNKLLGARNEPLLRSVLVANRQFQDLVGVISPGWS
jgi:hypothetical protein